MSKDQDKEVSVFRPHKPGLRKILGDLEADIMETIWERGEDAQVTVREVHTALEQKRGAAYTTVMTVMGVLAKKGILLVEKDSFAHRYQAKQTKEEFTRTAVGDILDQLLSDFAEPTFAHFAEGLQDEDPQKIQFLQELIARRREREQ